MSRSKPIRSLPAFSALDAHLVVCGEKRGASLQLDETYFTGQLNVLRAIDSVPGSDRRIRTIQESFDLYEDIHIDFESLTHDSLWTASRRFRELLQQLPEVIALRRTFPETCFVVPEWLRTGGVVQYGARVYFFRDDDAPEPEAILRENIEAVLTEEREQFDRYQGRLHGYPDCCIDFFHDRTGESPPEIRAVEPFSEIIDDETLDGNSNRSASIDRVLPGVLDSEGYKKFFAKAFYPEPGCDAARTKGTEMYDELNGSYPEQLVKDFYRLNFGICYLRARGVVDGRRSHPTPGTLGKEHLYFYLPMNNLLTLPRYS